MNAHLRRGSCKKLRAPRGQAVTEAGLGILVFVTILVFGIHFAELGYLSVKVPEVAASAMWDATAYKHNTMGSTIDMSPRAGAVSTGKSKAQSRYDDLDGRQSHNAGTVKYLFTQLGRVNVTCQEDGNFAPLALEDVMTKPVFQDAMGGMWCRAEARLNLIGIDSFNDAASGGGFFKVQHVATGKTSYNICSLGRDWGGRGCDQQGQLYMSLGDWGLTDQTEADECELSEAMTGCSNGGYFEAAKRLYELNGAGGGVAGAALALALKLPPMIDENHFFMSYRGETSPYGAFREQDPSSHDGDTGPRFTVTPGGSYQAVPQYQQAYSQRKQCWLGLPCNFGT